MFRGLSALLVAGAVLSSEAAAQTVPASVDCRSGHLGAAERETCASADLTQLTASVDSLTARLERTLTGRDRQALVDTESPFVRQRNDCSNGDSLVHECVERLLRSRLDALSVAATSPSSILAETTRYSFVDVPYVLRWGSSLVGKRVYVWGQMTLDPGATPGARVHGAVHDRSAASGTASLPVLFKTMNGTRARWFYDAKQPSAYWEGTLERRDAGFVLAEVQP